jgi:hypothetical protein
MINDPEWYEEMTKAMRAREHALTMLDRWTTRRDEAQTRITELSAQEQTQEQE